MCVKDDIAVLRKKLSTIEKAKSCLVSKNTKLNYRTLKCNDFFEIISRISSTYKKETEGGNPSSVNLCGRRESNPYASRHQILSLACLPISTRPRRMDCKDMNIFHFYKNRFSAEGYFWNLMQHQLSIESWLTYSRPEFAAIPISIGISST